MKFAFGQKEDANSACECKKEMMKFPFRQKEDANNACGTTMAPIP
jgi:hypothetical protein